VLVILLLTLGFLMPAPMPAMAASGDAIFWTSMGLFSVLGASAIAYAIWEKSRPADQPRVLNGEFYAGGFMGAAFTPSQNLTYRDGFSLNNGVTLTSQGSATLFSNQFNTSLTGGVKLGYFFHSIPYLGLEGESSVNNSYVNRRTLSTSRPILGSSQAAVPNDFWINWTTALHIVGRYGFLPDQDVPFGRLQPYVGIGPAVICLYEEVDSAKNFGIM
jgi:hypothetical protein